MSASKYNIEVIHKKGNKMDMTLFLKSEIQQKPRVDILYIYLVESMYCSRWYLLYLLYICM